MKEQITKLQISKVEMDEWINVVLFYFFLLHETCADETAAQLVDRPRIKVSTHHLYENQQK